MYLTQKQAKDKEFIYFLASQALSQPITSLEKLEGQMACNYELNHHYIFKLPSSRTNPDDWLKQSQYMPKLQENISFQIPIPQVKKVYSPDKQSFISSLYEKIDGTCIPDTFQFAQKDKRFKIKFFEQLSDITYQFHQIPPEKLPLKLLTKPEILEQYFFHRLKKIGTPFQKKIFKKVILNSFFGLGKSNYKISHLSHSDLHCGNVVLNDKNKIVGILDFDTFGRGDPFWEFRPKLYTDSADIRLFQKIYSKRSQNKINQTDINNMNQCFSSLKFLYSIYALANTLIPLNRQPLKEKKLSSKIFGFLGMEKSIS